jgi:hypothetical protein
MEKTTKIIIIIVLIFILSIFIYNYACTKFAFQVNPSPIPISYDCLQKIKAGTVCPDCITPKLSSQSIIFCPQTNANPFCKI